MKTITKAIFILKQNIKLKHCILTMIIFFTPIIGGCNLDAQENPFSKALQKQIKKQYKTKIEEYQKEGWKIFGSTNTIEVALLEHYNELFKKGAEVYEVVGIASKFKSKSVGRQMAINNACITYAQSAKSDIQGHVISNMAGDGVHTDNEFNNFYATYERLVAFEIKGELKESYAIIRDLKDGTFEMQVYYIVEQNSATEMCKRAIKKAIEESNLSPKHAKKLPEFSHESNLSPKYTKELPEFSRDGSNE